MRLGPAGGGRRGHNLHGFAQFVKVDADKGGDFPFAAPALHGQAVGGGAVCAAALGRTGAACAIGAVDVFLKAVVGRFDEVLLVLIGPGYLAKVNR